MLRSLKPATTAIAPKENLVVPCVVTLLRVREKCYNRLDIETAEGPNFEVVAHEGFIILIRSSMTNDIPSWLAVGIIFAQIIGPWAFLLLFSQVCYWIAKQESIDRDMLVAYPATFKLIVGLILLIPAGATEFAMRRSPGPWDAWGVGALTTIVFLPFLLLIEVVFARIVWNNETIDVRSPWRRRRIVPIGAVENWYYSTWTSCYIIQTRGYGRLRISILQAGGRNLLAAIPRQKASRPTASPDFIPSRPTVEFRQNRR